jgi:thiol:disulfide interchange protein DsbC
MKITFNRWSAGGSLLLAALCGATLYAATPAATPVLDVLHARLPKTKVDKIDCKRVPGLCEVQAGNNLFYTDRSARYLIIGRVYDMDTRQDLTAARLLEMNPAMLLGGAANAARAGDDASPSEKSAGAIGAVGNAGAAFTGPKARVDLAVLPKNGGIQWGSGSRTLTVFSDFHCTYCERLHTQLRMMNVRVVERPISVLGTRMISNAVICSADQKSAMQRAYAQENLPAATKCDTSGLDANEAFARKHGFDGTPVIVREDGAVLQGFRPREFLEQWMKGGAG